MTQDDQLIRRAAERARLRSEYVGWILAQYGEIEGMDEGQVQEQLRISSDDWPRLHLCLRPRAGQFLQDVTSIAKEFGANRDALATMIRRVEAQHELRMSQPSGKSPSLSTAPE